MLVQHRCPAEGCTYFCGSVSGISKHKAKKHPELLQKNGGVRAGQGRKLVEKIVTPKRPRGRPPKEEVKLQNPVVAKVKEVKVKK